MAPPIRAIFGLRGFASSASAALTRSLVNRCRELTASRGSTLFTLTWKRVTTPSGRSHYLLRASGRRTADTASSLPLSGWPTPNAGPQNDNDSQWETRREALKAEHRNGNGFGLTLAMAASLSAWPTTRETDGEKNVRTLDGSLREIEHKGSPQDLAQAASLASWATPTVNDAAGSEYAYSSGDHTKPVLKLPGQAKLTVALLQPPASGETPNGSTAGTASTGQLNPSMSRWLMGLPPSWDTCAPAAKTRSRKR